MKLHGLIPNFYIPVSVKDLYIHIISPPNLLYRVCEPIVGIYKSLTDTLLKKLGMRPHSFILGNICFDFTGQCISNAASSRENFGSCIREKENYTCHTAIQLFGKWKIQEILVTYPRNLVYDTPHFNENAKQIFPEMKLCCLISNFYIPVSVVPTISPPILLYCVCKPIMEIYI